MGVPTLSISYPDFKLNDIIDPESFDINNAEIVNKINSVIGIVNTLTDSVSSGGSGADNISLTAVAPFASTKLQAFLVEVLNRLKSSTSGSSGSEFIGSSSIAGVTGSTVLSQLISLKALLDGLQAQVTANVNALATHKVSPDHDLRYYIKAEIDSKLSSKSDTATSYTRSQLDGGQLDTRYFTESELLNGGVIDARYHTRTALDNGQLDTRYYTEAEVDSKLAANASGNHSGTWQGLTPSQAAEPVNGARLDVLEGVKPSPAPIPLDLGYGNQVIDMPRTAPYNVMSFKGLTRVNLMGSSGNFESFSRYFPFQASIALDSTNKTAGMTSLKVTVADGHTTGVGATVETFKFYAGRKYILIGDVKNGNATSVLIQLTTLTPGGIGGTPAVTDTNKFTTIYKKFSPSVDALASGFNAVVIGAAGTYGYFDSCRVYELSDAEYVAVDSMTIEQINAKYPYVDSLQPVKNPYVIAYGQNMLPPFTEWGVVNSAIVSIDGAYSFSCVPTNIYSGLATSLNLVPGQTYTYSGASSGGVSMVDVLSYDINGNQTVVGGISASGNFTFTVPNNSSRVDIQITSAGNSSTQFKATNPMLNLGTTQKPHVPRNDQMIVFSETFCSNVDGSVADESYRVGEDYYKLKHFELRDLDGNLPWEYDSNSTGYKVVKILQFANYLLNASSIVVKYDGKIIPNTGSVSNGGDLYAENASYFYLTIRNVDSGWGESYNPTQAEIQAFINGWKMYNNDTNPSGEGTYNGSGTKGWCYRAAPMFDGGTLTLPTTKAPINSFWQPYKLQYQLAKPVPQKIIPEGEITLSAGLSRIEVGNGMVLREKANPLLYAPEQRYYINHTDPLTPLKNRSNNIMFIFKDGKVDNSWTIFRNTGYGNGGSFSSISKANYDPTAAYTVTYIAEQYAVTCNIQSIKGQYAANLKTVNDELAHKQASIATRVSVLETQKASKVQGQWIVPILFNGWVPTGGIYGAAQYLLDDLGFVNIQGNVKDGSMPDIFYLPKGCRPKNTLEFTITKYNSGYSTITLIIYTSGLVQVTSPGGAVSFTGVRFRAEQ